MGPGRAAPPGTQDPSGPCVTPPPEAGATSHERVGAGGRAEGSGRLVLPRWAEVALWAAIAAPFLARASIVVRANWNWFVQRLPDDGFYYLEIGRRLGAGEGSTFDGVNATNGYHPLWQWIVAGLSIPFDDDLALVRAVALVQLALVAVAVVVVVRVLRRATGPLPALLAGVVAASSRLPVVAVDAMEGAVVVLVLALLVWALEVALARGRRRDLLVVGALTAVAVLARLDLVLVAWVVPLVLWVKAPPRGERWRAPLDWLAGAATVGVPYAAWHLARWGEPLTTSARIKQHWVDEAALEQYGGRFTSGYLGAVVDRAGEYGESLGRGLTQLATARGVVVWGLLLLAVVGAVAAVRERRAQGGGPFGPAATALGAGAAMVVVKACIDLFSSPSWAATWYASPQRLAFPLAVGALAGKAIQVLARRSVPASGAIVGLVVLACLAGGLSRATFDPREELRDGLWQVEAERAAAWVLAEGPPGRYGARDAGLLGFRLHGERTVVNLDGLVNDDEFAELVLADAPLRLRVADQEVDVLVNRLSDEERARWDDCAVELYRSEVLVPSYDPLLGGSAASPVAVLDVRSCRP